ncbi:MAG: UPF0182 family membrane protein [Candidatus Geothermincolia bacterium]
MGQPRFPWDDLLRGGDRGDGGDRGPSPQGPVTGFGRWWQGLSNRTKRIGLTIIIALVIIIASASWLSFFYTDYLWFNEVGFTSVFWKEITTRILTFLVFGAAFFALLYGNLLLAKKLTPGYELVPEQANPMEDALAAFRLKAGRFLNWGTVIVSAFLAFFVAWASSRQWDTVLRYFNAESFGKAEPIFGKDIGFYIFKLPMHRYISGWLFAALIGVFILTALAHFFYGAINFSRKEERFAPHVKLHLSVIGGAILLVQAWRFRLDMFGLMYSPRGTVIGASYTDVHAQLPALWIVLATALVAAILLLVNVRFKGWRLPAAGLAVMVVVFIAAAVIYPAIVQAYVVQPKELAREERFIKYNIEFTQDAFNLQNDGETPGIVTTEYPADDSLTAGELAANRATIDNIRIWDPRLLLQVLQQRQVLRQEYTFDDVDVERYTLANGVYTQMLVSGRELVFDQLRSDAKSWQNEHLTYTHGYGMVMVPSAEQTSQGDPRLAIKDIPPVSEAGVGIEITQPEIYYGEKTQDYVLVKTTAPEIDYPAGSTSVNVDPAYQGTGGVQIDSFIKRLAFSIRNSDITLLFSGYVTDESRLMFRRNIIDRVTAVAPWLTLDDDPYLVVDAEGRQQWILDGYMTSDLYPYAEYREEINYIRNSVKVVVDAFNGGMTFYLIDENDPIARTYARIFPDLFTSFEEMPQDLKAQIRYPEDMFSMQMELYKTYHINDVGPFYHKEDLWDSSMETYGAGASSQPVDPYYVILKIPGEPGEEMALIEPFNAHGKDNMVSWVAARCDEPNYGKLISFVFPSGKLVNGTQQFEALVDQTPEISREITLLNQAGSQVIRGNTLVIPIEKSILYVEPLYLLATNPAIPQLRNIIVGFGNRVLMRPTLEEALTALFEGTGAPVVPTPTTPVEPQPSQDAAALIRQANDLYNQAQEALRRGDLAAYAGIIEQLGGVLAQLQAQAGAE